MLKIFDKDHNAIGHIVKYRDCRIESEVATGDKTLSFVYLGKYHNLENEMYVQTKEDEYVIKEVPASTDSFPQIVAVLNLEELQKDMWQSFSVTDTTIDGAARTLLAGTGWTIGSCDVTKRRNAGMMQVSSLEAIQKLCTAFMCEPVFDTLNKTISFYEQRGEDKGTYFMSGLNLKKLQKKSTSYDYYTRLIPLGENGLSIESVNEGKNYLENFQYSNKVLTLIWKDESYTDPQALMEDAARKLEDLSRPEMAYSVEVRDLAAQKPEYSILSYGEGDTVQLIDQTTGTMVKQRIKKLVRYPDNPEKNTCEIANTILTFEEMQQKYQDAADIIHYTVTGDGRYTGKISVSDILKFEEGLKGSSTIGGLNSDISTMEGTIGEVDARVGSLEANYVKVEELEAKEVEISGQLKAVKASVETLDADYVNFKSTTTEELAAQRILVENITAGEVTTEYLEANYADIALSNVKTESVGTLFARIGILNDVTIAEGYVTGVLNGVRVNADVITAGTLSVDRLLVTGKDSIVYQINAQASGLSVEELSDEKYQRYLNGTNIVAGSITGDRIAAGTITANEIDVSNLFAQEIEATGTIKGLKLEAATGTIGCWFFGNDRIYDSGYSAGINKNGFGQAFWAGGTDLTGNLAPFRVSHDGEMIATKANITGSITATTLTATSRGQIGPWFFNDTAIYKVASEFGASTSGAMYFGNNGLSINKNFKVDSSGMLFAEGATVKGTIVTGNITATGGTVGCWTITSERMYNATNTVGYMGVNKYGSGQAFWAGGTDLTGGSAPFRVGHNGALVATNVDIIGSIKATTVYLANEIYIMGKSWITNHTDYQLLINHASGNINFALVFNTLTTTSIVCPRVYFTYDYSSSWINGPLGYAALDLMEAGGSTGVNWLARIKTTNGAWAIGGYNADETFNIVYANASRLSSATNGTDARMYINSTGVVGSSGGFASGNTKMIPNKNGLLLVGASGYAVHVGQGLSGSSVYTFGPRNSSGAALDGKMYLGGSSNRWYWIYSSSGSVHTSDVRDKNISDLDDRYKELFMKLEPIKFTWKDDSMDKTIHIGLKAQDTEQAAYECGLANDEIGAIVHDYWTVPNEDGRTDRYSMQYEEILMLSVPFVQRHELTLIDHTAKLTSLRNQFASAETRLTSVEQQLQQVCSRLDRLAVGN